MLQKIEGFLLNQFAGKLIARGVILGTAWVVGQAGVYGVTLSSSEISGLLMVGANWAFEWYKARRMKNPASPAVQTDANLIAPTVPLP